MLGMLTGFARSRVGGFAAIGLGVLLLIGAWRVDHTVQVRRLERAAASLAGARAELVQGRANTAALKSALSAQNSAVSRLQADARARETRAQAEVGRARKAREAAEARASRILATRPGPDRCTAADKLILESLR